MLSSTTTLPTYCSRLYYLYTIAAFLNTNTTYIMHPTHLIRHREPCDKALLIKSSNCSRVHFQDTYEAVKRTLRIQLPETSVRDLAVTFGCLQMVDQVQIFVEIVGQFVAVHVPATAVDRNCVHATCFALICKAFKVGSWRLLS